MLIKRLSVLVIVGSFLGGALYQQSMHARGIFTVDCCDCDKQVIMLVAILGFITTIIFEDDFQTVPQALKTIENSDVTFVPNVAVSAAGDAYKLERQANKKVCQNVMNQFVNGGINTNNLSFLGRRKKDTQEPRNRETKKRLNKQNKNHFKKNNKNW